MSVVHLHVQYVGLICGGGGGRVAVLLHHTDFRMWHCITWLWCTYFLYWPGDMYTVFSNYLLSEAISTVSSLFFICLYEKLFKRYN